MSDPKFSPAHGNIRTFSRGHQLVVFSYEKDGDVWKVGRTDVPIEVTGDAATVPFASGTIEECDRLVDEAMLGWECEGLQVQTLPVVMVLDGQTTTHESQAATVDDARLRMGLWHVDIENGDDQ